MSAFMRITALLFLAVAPLLALDPDLRLSQYQKQQWQVEQGLPHSYVTAVRQSPGGHVLIGTDEGLARFDGLTFRALDADPALRLLRRWVSALWIARDRSIWIGTFDGQIIQLRDRRTLNTYQAGGSVFDLLETPGGVVWASTRNGVFRVSPTGLTPDPALPAPLETSWNVLAHDVRDGVWVVTSRGLHRYRNGHSELRLANSTALGDILTVHAARGDVLWLGTSKGLLRLTAKNDPAPIGGVTGPVVSLLEDHDGTLWAGTWGHGLYRVASPRAEQWSTRDGLADDFIRTLTEDSEGNLWIGTRSGGLSRWRETRVVPYGVAEGLAGNYATTVAADPAGKLWLGTWRGGFYRLDGNTLTPQPTPLPTLYFSLRALAFDRTGHQWLGNWEGLFEFDGKRYIHYATRPDSPYRRVSALMFARDGALWIGTSERGVYRFAGSRPEGEPAAYLISSAVTALYEDSTGVIWIGTTRGLARATPGSTAAIVPGLPAESVESIFEDSRHRVWVSTSAGILIVITPHAQHVIGRSHGLPNHPLYRVLEDGTGSYWVSSPRGLYEISDASVTRVLETKTGRLDVRLYDQDEGLRTIECHGLSQPSGGRDAAGNLWFPTAKGFVKVRPGARRPSAPPPVEIEEIKSDSGPVARAAELQLPAGTRNLEVQFTALRLSTPGKVQFRYRLEGFDPDWIDAGNERVARYNQLPPGRFRFAVAARDPFGDWSAPATLMFLQEPRFYQTWWFLVLMFLFSVTLVVSLYRWRLHSVRSRYAAIAEERNRIGREWHDTLVAGFSAISLQLEAAVANVKDQPGRALDILDVTRKMVHHYRAEARRVIWDLRDNRPEGETLPMAVENALRRVTENRGIAGTVTVEGVETDLPVDLQHNMLRICQEAIANAARHANPTSIQVTITYAPHLLKAVVRDDGRGFRPDSAMEASGHYGLTVMQERARRYGGSLRIDGKPGAGTVVEACVPFRGDGKS